MLEVVACVATVASGVAAVVTLIVTLIDRRRKLPEKTDKPG